MGGGESIPPLASHHQTKKQTECTPGWQEWTEKLAKFWCKGKTWKWSASRHSGKSALTQKQDHTRGAGSLGALRVPRAAICVQYHSREFCASKNTVFNRTRRQAISRIQKTWATPSTELILLALVEPVAQLEQNTHSFQVHTALTPGGTIKYHSQVIFLLGYKPASTLKIKIISYVNRPKKKYMIISKNIELFYKHYL